jgi:hypothetical protein
MSNPAGTTLGELLQRKETKHQQSIYDEGWNDCKKEVLKILKKDWTGFDLSINSCDNHYIEKVEKL